MMPYVGRLPALWGSRPVMIVGFDATHVLCVVDSMLQYVEHKEITIPWHGDEAAMIWEWYGGPREADASDTDVAVDDDAGDGDTRD